MKVLAVCIGVNNASDFKKLDNAINDAKSIENISKFFGYDEFNKFLKEPIQVAGSSNSIDKITGIIMITGLALLIPLSFIASFFTGLLHYTEHQNLISAVSIAMLYFGSISMFGFLQYKILKSTSTP